MLGTLTAYGRVTALIEATDGLWYKAVDRHGGTSLIAVATWDDIHAKYECKEAGQ